MQTTLRLNDELYREAKMAAAREGVTLTRFLEDVLRNRVRLTANAPAPKTATRLPVSRRRGGLFFPIRSPFDFEITAARAIENTILAPPSNILVLGTETVTFLSQFDLRPCPTAENS